MALDNSDEVHFIFDENQDLKRAFLDKEKHLEKLKKLILPTFKKYLSDSEIKQNADLNKINDAESENQVDMEPEYTLIENKDLKIKYFSKEFTLKNIFEKSIFSLKVEVVSEIQKPEVYERYIKALDVYKKACKLFLDEEIDEKKVEVEPIVKAYKSLENASVYMKQAEEDLNIDNSKSYRLMVGYRTKRVYEKISQDFEKLKNFDSILALKELNREEEIEAC